MARRFFYDKPDDLMSQPFDKAYTVESIEARDNQIVVTFREDNIIPNDLNAERAKEQLE